MRALLISLLTGTTLLVALACGLGSYSSRHYLPQQQMNAALAAGDGCALFLGDSRMVAAFDADALHASLRAAGRERCLAPLAIGATDASGMFVTAREYLSRGRRPTVAVVGKVGDSLLGPPQPLRGEDWVGNNAIHLLWTQPGDVFAEVPGFPSASLAAFDEGFRFLVARATPLGRYQSLFAVRLQRVQDALLGTSPGAVNRFGALGDMARLEDDLRARAPERLERAMRGPASQRLGPWFARLTALLEDHGIPLVIVELPMRGAYRAGVTDSPQAIAYQRWLDETLTRGGGALVDLSREDWVDDSLFVDELHVGRPGAAVISRRTGERLGAWLGARETRR